MIWKPMVLAAVAAALLVTHQAPARAEGRTGVVLMHGKAGTPDHVRGLATTLEQAGYLTASPEMPWSQRRRYDAALEQSHQEIDATIADLKRRGADRIVIAGHSMGGNMAIGYAATHPDLAAVVAIGPGQTVDGENFAAATGEGVAKARSMIAADRGDEKASFPELHLGKRSTVTTSARIYASYFDPDGYANMPVFAKLVTQPLMWIVGTLDKPMMDRGRAYAFDRLPPDPRHAYVEVTSDHMGTPEAAKAEIAAWLLRVAPPAP